MNDANHVKIGILLGTRGLVMRAQQEGRPVDATPLLSLAKQAESGGLDSVWVGDSLVSKPRLEPVTAMAAIAASTSRVRIGTAVMLPAIRHPVPLAHSLATADIVSGGRLVLGMGVGGAFTTEQQQDWLAAGVEPKTRAGRFTELVQLLKLLWTKENVTFNGKHFQLNGITLDPKPTQDGGPPLLLATHYRTGSEAQALRAARHSDGIIGITDSPEQFAATATKVDELAHAEGRGLSTFERAFYMTVNVSDDANAAAAEADDFLMAYYGVRHWGESWGPWGGAGLVTERMAAYAAAGANHLIVRFASWDQETQLDRFVREVVPALRAGGLLGHGAR